MIIDGMYGLGDTIYERCVVREIKERVYLRTSWPELFVDLDNIKCIRPRTNLRTQKKNIARQVANVWHDAPSLPAKKLTYTAPALRQNTILSAMKKCVGVNQLNIFNMPNFPAPNIPKPYVVARPNTYRSEWINYARPCDEQYIIEAANILQEQNSYVVSVADIDGKKEWCKSLPQVNLEYNKGELDFVKLMGLIQHASLVVGSVGWIVPACIAFGVPLITLLGGQGGHNSPTKLISAPMNTDKVRFLEPDNYCMCTDVRHACDKTITNFNDKFIDAIRSLKCSKE